MYACTQHEGVALNDLQSQEETKCTVMKRADGQCMHLTLDPGLGDGVISVISLCSLIRIIKGASLFLILDGSLP